MADIEVGVWSDRTGYRLTVNSRDRTGTPHVNRTLQDPNPEGHLRSVPTDPTCGPNEVSKQSVANLPPSEQEVAKLPTVESRPSVRRTRRVVVRTCGPTGENEEACAAVSGDQRVSYNSLQCKWSECECGEWWSLADGKSSEPTTTDAPTVVTGVGGVRASSGEAGHEARGQSTQVHVWLHKERPCGLVEGVHVFLLS
ncbi:hypothetical protein PC114_g7415 [Phytophthora cactorum]|nr:hypothetical protein PC114_g7415 [Phytophthora cactorum]